MSDDNEKAARERACFSEFATVAALPVIPDTVASRKPPEPDIVCEIRDDGLVAFEMVDLIDEGLAKSVARARDGDIEGCWYGTPPLDVIRRKCRKHYQTAHPIELVVCAGEEEFELAIPPEPTFEDRASQLLESSQFRRIWVFRKTRSAKAIWFTCAKSSLSRNAKNY